MSVSPVAELRRLHVVIPGRAVIHTPYCPRHRHREATPIGDDKRYWRGELRAGECCLPIVPLPDAPADAPGWKWAA